jgi:hypothetical protein
MYINYHDYDPSWKISMNMQETSTLFWINIVKRLEDAFIQGLLSRNDFCFYDKIEPNPVDIALRWTNLYPYNNKHYHNFNETKFKDSNHQFKIHIEMNEFRLDPHRFRCTKKSLFPNDLKIDILDKFDLNLRKKFVDGWGWLVNSNDVVDEMLKLPNLQRLKKRTELSNDEICIFQIPNINLFQECNVPLEHKNERIHFMENYQNYCITHDLIVNENDIDKKDIDCIVAGQVAPIIYPFRFIASSVLQKNKDIKLINLGDDYVQTYQQIGNLQTKYNNSQIPLEEANILLAKLATEQQGRFFSSIKRAKLGVGCSSVFGMPLKKYFEYMAGGCVVVGDLPHNAKSYGLEHMVNCFECSIDELNDAVMYLLENHDLRHKLAINGLKLVHERYTTNKQVDLFIGELDRIVGLYK